MKLASGVLIAGIVLVCTSSGRSQEFGFWGFLTEGRTIARCADKTAATAAAWERFYGLNQRLRNLSDRDPMASALEALRAVLKSECFVAAAETDRLPEPDSTASLKEWWINGGDDWLASYLRLPEYGLRDHLRPHVLVPPDTRRTMYRSADSAYPFSVLLCAMGDLACGAATKGWVARAETAFAVHEAQANLRQVFPEPDPAPEAVSARCARESETAKPNERYQEWRDCVEQARPKRAVFPIGGFRAPSAGWLIVTGRRGHYHFCDGASAYDLGSGAALRFESCSALALPGGSVDREATNRGRRERITYGAISAENLREAAWMLLLRSTTEERQTEVKAYPLSEGMKVDTVVRWSRGMSGSFAGGNTGQTRLQWAFVNFGQPTVIGTVTWPMSYESAEHHAVSLLKVTEDGLVPGCTSQAPPPLASVEAGPPVFLDDANSRDQQELIADYREALAKWGSVASCR